MTQEQTNIDEAVETLEKIITYPMGRSLAELAAIRSLSTKNT